MARTKTAGQLKTTSKSQKTAWFRLWQFNGLNSFEFQSINGKVLSLIPALFMQIAFTSGDCFMSEILSNLAEDCHRILSETPGPDGEKRLPNCCKTCFRIRPMSKHWFRIQQVNAICSIKMPSLAFVFWRIIMTAQKHHHRMIMGRHGRFTPKPAAKPKCAILTRSKMPAPKKQARFR